ncbi:MAG: hypothetical protein HZB53_12390 [Chloroflexi bacterium]|nr:hypothetical protein [Chloroflexota bacterium]
MTDNPDTIPASAEALNTQLRDARNTAAPAPEAHRLVSHEYGDRLHAGWMLAAPSGLSDLRRLSSLARVPLLGGLLVFLRELGSAVWLLAQRRSLIMQQIRFNETVASSFIYLQDMTEIGMQLDREVQSLKTDVGNLDASLLAHADRLSARLDRLEARMAALEQALDDGRLPQP